MKKLIPILTILTIISLFACDKRNQKGYKIENWAGVELSLTTPDGSYIIPPTSTLKITSSGDYNNFTYLYEGLKSRIDVLGNHPVETIMVVTYKHDFAVFVDSNKGEAQSVRITINGETFDEKLPFYYGTDNHKSTYSITVKPIGGTAYTIVKVDDRKVNSYKHKNNETGTLTGNL